jgi:hypothetical protein
VTVAPLATLAPSAALPAEGLSSSRRVSQGNANTVKFGRFGLERLGNSLDAFVPFTQAFTEDFFWQFVTLDIFALWMPRIYNSLTRGRQTYYDLKRQAEQDSATSTAQSANQSNNPSKNATNGENSGAKSPAAKSSTVPAQPNEFKEMASIATATVKGLNWGYFAEEAGREFLVGPGFFTLFGVVNSLYKLGLNQSIRLPLTALTRFSDAFGQALANEPAATTPMTAEKLATIAANSLEHSWKDSPHFQALKPQFMQWKQNWQQYLLAMHTYEQKVPRTQRWANGVSHWWQTRPFQPDGKKPTQSAWHQAVTHAENQLDKSAEKLKRAVVHYNHQQTGLNYKQLHHVPLNVPVRMSKVRVDTNPVNASTAKLQHKTAQKTAQLIEQQMPLYISEWLDQAKQWHQFPLDIMQGVAKQSAAGVAGIKNASAPAANTASATAVAISKQVAKRLNHFTGLKLTTSLLSTGLIGLYLVYLTKLFQSSKQYPGNRSRRSSDFQLPPQEATKASLPKIDPPKAEPFRAEPAKVEKSVTA